jgi:hypothetical protein
VEFDGAGADFPTFDVGWFMFCEGFLKINLNRDEINDRLNRSGIRVLSQWRGLRTGLRQSPGNAARLRRRAMNASKNN